MPIEPLTGVIESSRINKNFSYLDSKVDSINGGPLGTLTSVSELNSKYPNGANGFFVVLESDGKTGYMYTWDGTKWVKGLLYQAQGVGAGTIKDLELAKNAVGPVKTNFIKTGKNKLNPAEIQYGGYHWNGTWTSSATYDSSGKIPVQASQKWSATYARFITFYDINYNHVDGISNPTDGSFSWTVPPNTSIAYQEVCFGKTIENMQIEEGDKLTAYEPFEIMIENATYTKSDIKNFRVEHSDIEFQAVDTTQTTFIISGSNKFDTGKVTKGYYVHPDSGVLLDNPNYDTSDFIRRDEAVEDKLTVNHSRFYAFFDENNKYISGGNGNTAGFITLVWPTKALFFRTSHESKYSNEVQVNFSQSAFPFERYRKVLQGITVNAEDVISTEKQIESILPKKMYGTVGEELRIYQKNILDQGLKLNTNYDATAGTQLSDYYSLIPSNEGTTNLTVQFFKGMQLVFSSVISIVSKAMRSTKTKGLILGDSTINALHEIQRIIDKMGSNAELYGSRGTGTNKHEGRGGWTFAMYRTATEYAGVVNPFYDPVKKDFSFAYYAAAQSLPPLDFVYLQLGINDTFGFTDDTKLLTAIQTILNHADYIINDIRNFNPSIKIGLGITFPPSDHQDAFGASYQTGQTQWRYKHNNFIWCQELMKKYQEDINVQLVPIHCAIDTNKNIADAIHPTTAGYYQLGDQVVAWLNSL